MVRLTDRPAMTIAVELGRKTTKQTNKQDEGAMHALILGNIAPLSGCEFKTGKPWRSRNLEVHFIYLTYVDVCTPTLLHAKISLHTAQSYQHLCF